jgi:hypothetical protein
MRAPLVRFVFAALALGAAAFAAGGCATVKPQERAVLADPIMQFEGDPKAAAQLRHAIENREGSYGGAGVSGGGCGCN